MDTIMPTRSIKTEMPQIDTGTTTHKPRSPGRPIKYTSEAPTQTPIVSNSYIIIDSNSRKHVISAYHFCITDGCLVLLNKQHSPTASFSSGSWVSINNYGKPVVTPNPVNMKELV